MADIQRISDFSGLIPIDTITLGSNVLTVTPLTLEEIELITAKIEGYIPILVEHEITFENYQNPLNLLKLVKLSLKHAPHVLEEVTKISAEDMKKMLPSHIMQIIKKAIEVNKAANADFLGNLESLTTEVEKVVEEKSAKPSPQKNKKRR